MAQHGMVPAALSLTCKDAFEVFSQNETLRLQMRVTELESRLAKYEVLSPRRFETKAEYRKVEREANDFLFQWIRNNFRACDFFECQANGFDAMHNHPHFMHAIEKAIYMITNNQTLAYNLSCQCMQIAEAAVEAANYCDMWQNPFLLNSAWCRDQTLVADIVCRSLLPDTIPELIQHANAVEIPHEDEFEVTTLKA